MKNFGSSIKSAVKNFFKRKNPAQFFIAMMALSLIIWLVSSLIVREKNFSRESFLITAPTFLWIILIRSEMFFRA